VAIESPKLSANSLGEIKAARENFIPLGYHPKSGHTLSHSKTGQRDWAKT
jgi:hypothetical protein